MYTIILLISHFAFFFSLFHAKWTNFSFPHLLFPHIYTQTQTHPHPQTNISTQTNQHRNTQTHPHTNTSTQKYTNTLIRTNQQKDKPVLVLVACGSVDRRSPCLWVLILVVLVALDQSSWVDKNGSRCLWISVCSGDRYLWVNENGF